MKSLMLFAALVMPSLSNAQDVKSLESCAYSESLMYLQVTKIQSERGLRTTLQMDDLVRNARKYCIEEAALTWDEKFSSELAETTLKNSVERAGHDFLATFR